MGHAEGGRHPVLEPGRPGPNRLGRHHNLSTERAGHRGPEHPLADAGLGDVPGDPGDDPGELAAGDERHRQLDLVLARHEAARASGRPHR
jgi:hypothetical protein